MKIGFLIYPNVTQLDFSGPIQFLSMMPNTKVDVVWKDKHPVNTDSGFTLNPSMSFEEAPQFDVIVVPGGPGQRAIVDDTSYVDFVRDQGSKARYIMGVCTGSLILGRAGLLKGYRAGCHWAFSDELAQFGCTFIDERVVIDRNRITGGGVTSGMDIALRLIDIIAGEMVAKTIQLALEYEPVPPFHAGRPELAGPQLEAVVREMFNKSGLLSNEEKSV